MKPIAIALTPLALAPLALTACATSSASTPIESSAPSPPPLAFAALGETVYVDGPKVTPLEVLEDSRCPAKVMCVWAGRVRISARIHLGSGDETREMTLGKPIQVADGSLELARVVPDRQTPDTVARDDYRFGFRFAGGL